MATRRRAVATRSLDERVLTLEIYFKVALALLTALGISAIGLGTAFWNARGSIESLKGDATKLKAESQELHDQVKQAREDALGAINLAGDEKLDALKRLLENLDPNVVAKGILKEGVRDVLVRDCGKNQCACPAGWQRARNVGGDGDLNNKAEGNFIYLCVQRYGQDAGGS